MSMSGANADELHMLGRAFENAATMLEATQKSMRTKLHNSPWEGRDAIQFRTTWDSTHRGALNSTAQYLRAASVTLHDNGRQQTAASAASSGSPFSGPAAFQDPGSYEKFFTQFDKFAKETESSYPGAIALAREWEERLRSGHPTPGEMAAFDRYQAMIRLARAQTQTVRQTAVSALAELRTSIDKEQAVTLSILTAGAAKGLPTGAKGAGDLAGDVASGYLKGQLLDRVQNAIGADDPQRIVDVYTTRADDFLKQLGTNVKGSVVTATANSSGTLVLNASQQYDGWIDVAQAKGDVVSAFDVGGGTKVGDFATSALGTVMDTCVPYSGTVVFGLLDQAQATGHMANAVTYLDLAVNGSMRSLELGAQSMQFHQP